MDASRPGLGKVRRYGKPPFRVLVVHGGPGGLGSMAPVARELSRAVGVIEPWQSAKSVHGQVEELSEQVEGKAAAPVTVIGHSWGAWLALLFAARHPEKVRRLVLIGSGALMARYLAKLRRLGELAGMTDSYETIPVRNAGGMLDLVAYRAVWPEADEMRRSGLLLRQVSRVKAPITVVQGTSDPTPIEGVVDPMRRVGLHPRRILLARCGPEPWRERYARERFFDVLRTEIARD